MKTIYLVIFISIFSCKNDTATDLSDLHFPDPERDFIKLNRVDSTIIFIPQESGPDLRAYKTYDENGKVLAEGDDHGFVLYKYNSKGLLVGKKSKWDTGFRIDTIVYEFDKDSNLLLQKRSNSNVEFKFLFDNKRRLK